jgi:hypothetical protein
VTLLAMPFCCLAAIVIFGVSWRKRGSGSHAFEVCRCAFEEGRPQFGAGCPSGGDRSWTFPDGGE